MRSQITILMLVAGGLYALVRRSLRVSEASTRTVVSDLRQEVVGLGSAIGRASTREQVAGVFRQFEALIGLYTELALRRSLPYTRRWAMSPDALLVLAQCALAMKPRVVVECGSGVSTLILARCAELNGGGSIYSLEHAPSFAAVTRMHLDRHGLSQYATVLNAPLRKYTFATAEWKWYSLTDLPETEIDMLVVDGPPRKTGPLARYPAGPMLFARLKPGSLIFVDDADREEERMVVARWQAEHPELSWESRECEKGCVLLTKNAESVPEGSPPRPERLRHTP